MINKKTPGKFPGVLLFMSIANHGEYENSSLK